MLTKMLKELDSWLVSKNKRVTLHVIGGYALELKKCREDFRRRTLIPFWISKK